MIDSPDTVSICLNTYKRPIVYDCLRSLHEQDFPKDRLQIVVSDNDAEGSGSGPIERFVRDHDHSVEYRVVPDRNIAIARNDAVERTTGDWIIFIDDDEIAPPRWIQTMLDCARDYDADVVLGTVEAQYADGTPRWVERLDPMSKRWGPTGGRMKMGSTCNILVKAGWLRERGFAFDPRYGRAGCDDADLFHRLYRQGARIVICADAPLHEVVPIDRSNVAYLKRRFVRLGQSYAAITNRYRSPLRKLLFVADSGARCVAFLSLWLCLSWIDYSRAFGWRLRSWRNLGKLQQTMSGSLYEMY